MPAPSSITVTFVIRHLARDWPDLARLDVQAIAREPQRFVGGRNSWIAQTYLHLREALRDRGHALRLSDRAIPGTLCVVHRDDANSVRHAAPGSFLVVVRADRAPVAACDFAIAQNGLDLASHDRHVPLWPQPGLLPRDASRGTGIRRIVYQGRTGNAPGFFKDPRFRAALARRGASLDVRERHWEDYREADAALAAREAPPIVLASKPATKITNAWHAGVPVIAMPEPAYLELRRSPLDFFLADDADGVIAAVDRLRASPGLYEAMVLNGRKRAQAYGADAIRARWLELFDREFVPAFERSPHRRARRRAWFLGAMARQKVASRWWRTQALVQRWQLAGRRLLALHQERSVEVAMKRFRARVMLH